MLFGTISYSNHFAVAQQNATKATTTTNATTTNATKTTNVTNATKAATTSNATSANQTKTAGGTTTIAAAPTNTFMGRGWIDTIIFPANSTAASSKGPDWLLGGTWAIFVTNGQVQHLNAQFSMVRPNGTGYHARMIANFTSSGGQPISLNNGAATISGTANVYAGKSVKWLSVPITINITGGRSIVFHVDNAKTQNHFEGSPIYGVVTGLLSRNLQSLLPSAEPTTTGAPNATTTTTPSANQTANATGTNATTPAATTGGGGGGATIPVSIVSGASTKTTDAFSPDPVNAKVGDTVTWTNNDSQPHTVVSGQNTKPDGKFNSSPNFNPLITPGQTFSHKFTEAGTYPYFCQLHPNMVGTVKVS